jgi:pantoate kinase
MNNDNDKAGGNEISKAWHLVEKAGLASPTLRLLCEGIIKSGSKTAIESLMGMLIICIREKQEAYAEYKKSMAAVFKKKIDVLRSK